MPALLSHSLAACRTLGIALSIFALGGCINMPENVTPVDGFELPRYLGSWYEIARLDHRFERGLSQVTAQYSMREDGSVRVLNAGYNAEKDRWENAEGRAYFVNEPQSGYLKVSFFGPFFGSYIITELDKADYQYALVSGPDLSYLWILSRSPTLEPTVLEHLVGRAAALGFATDKLIYVEQKTASAE